MQTPSFSPKPELMTNLHGAFHRLPGGGAIELAFSLTVIAAAWILARHGGFLPSIGGLLIGGILLARHSYVSDLLIVLPGCLAAVALIKSSALRLLTLALLAPPTALAIQFGGVYSLGYTLGLWALLVGWAFVMHRLSKVEMQGTPA